MTDDRKQDHIDLAFRSRPRSRFELGDLTYEPMLGHLSPIEPSEFSFAKAKMKLPLWVSSMTGGTEKARGINQNLAKLCGEYGLGMGLGSCRPLLDDKRWEDFEVRNLMGPDAPLYSNFGIAQIEELIAQNKIDKIIEITKRLEANGVIVHVNPLQEFAQPEGDRYKVAPLETIKRLLELMDFPIIVKEVGQGMGPRSLAGLVSLPIEAIEFAAFGGTNFTMLEQSRHQKTDSSKNELLAGLATIGHTPEEMIGWINAFEFELECQQFIISGGVYDPIRAKVLNDSLHYPSAVGMASQFLKFAMGDYEQLQAYAEDLIEVYLVCDQVLKG
ncbi:MAG: isopentenyl-diphosphate delta-isomerase [Halobacteriovoraceae bacterium]|nr:isopentenyl-diphosphate delta-isomerase [Halobacteriovoraceae bacterium]|tara:strand:- start:51 stop:1040 length:990 start_codon:yes stop_codon:yes gene_type:complete